MKYCATIETGSASKSVLQSKITHRKQSQQFSRKGIDLVLVSVPHRPTWACVLRRVEAAVGYSRRVGRSSNRHIRINIKKQSNLY